MIHTAPNVQQSGTHLPAFFFYLLILYIIHIIFYAIKQFLPGVVSKADSCDISVYSRTLSTDVISFSKSTVNLKTHWNILDNTITCVTISPIYLPFVAKINVRRTILSSDRYQM